MKMIVNRDIRTKRVSVNFHILLLAKSSDILTVSHLKVNCNNWLQLHKSCHKEPPTGQILVVRQNQSYREILLIRVRHWGVWLYGKVIMTAISMNYAMLVSTEQFIPLHEFGLNSQIYKGLVVTIDNVKCSF